MPADRTERTSAASFAEAQALGLPLSSHGAKHAPSIARGLACKTCRSRKLKCDGAKPLCGSCRKSATIHGDDISTLVCTYDDPNFKKKRASPTSAAKVAQLEAEIAELKAALAHTRLASPPTAPPSAASSAPEDAPPLAGNDNNPLPYFPAIDSFPINSAFGPAASSSGRSLAGSSLNLSHATSSLRTSDEAWFSASGTPSGPPVHGPQGGGFGVPELSPTAAYSSSGDTSGPFTPPSDPLFDLLYPGWPRDLPTPELTNRLIDVYFTRPHMCTGVVNPTRFRGAMMLPPTSQGFPHIGLIHVVCAIASLMVPDDFFRHESYWRSHDKPVEYHLAKCQSALQSNLGFGPLFQTTQVYALLCYVLYIQARWVELWSYCGQATRVATPLGLNHVRAASDSPPGLGARFKGHLLKQTDEDDVLAERATTFFMALFADRCASASTGWPCSISDIDITTVIPSEGHPYPRGDDLAKSPLSLHNPSFFISHPLHLCGPQQLFMKAVVLLGKVVQFQQRAPYVSTTSGAGSALDDAISDMRTTDAFKRVDSMILAFLASIPRQYQFQHRPLGSGSADVLSETRICLVHGIAHVSSILLHEPYVLTLEEDEPSLVRCVASAQAILQSIFTILGTSYEVALFSPFVTYVWACAGRTFVRQIAIKLVKGVTHGLDELRSNVETILVVLKAHRTPLGDNTHDTLKALFDDPMRCLPRPFLAASTNAHLLSCSFTPTAGDSAPAGAGLDRAAAAAAAAAFAAPAGAAPAPAPSPDGPRFFELSQQASASPPADAHGGDALLRDFAAAAAAAGGGGGVVPGLDPSSSLMDGAGLFGAQFGGGGGGVDPLAPQSKPGFGGAASAPGTGKGTGGMDWYAMQGLQGLEQMLQMQ